MRHGGILLPEDRANVRRRHLAHPPQASECYLETVNLSPDVAELALDPRTSSIMDSISVERLGKKYQLGRASEGQRYIALRDVVAATASKFGGLFRQAVRPPNADTSEEPALLDHGRDELASSGDIIDDFWAIRDLSFEVPEGQVLGVIGRNGAGKSTLLKLLSRITEPTTGRIRIRGRVASLLEVGTGFHPELTGRENIFLNGAILGMSRAEIRRNFAAIVAFAEIERFLDTPVKRYSSGMYVRLAFAVAAHLEPEILIIDEVLAVGDAEFQKKCVGKMRDVSRSGRTVVFVSHNMAAIRHLCNAGLHLTGGKLQSSGQIDSVVDGYLEATRCRTVQSVSSEGLELTEFKICAAHSAVPLTSVVFGRDYEVRFTVRGDSRRVHLSPVISVHNDDGVHVSSMCGPEEGLDSVQVKGSQHWTARLPSMPLFPGRYTVSLELFGFEPRAYLEARDVLTFTVEGGMIPGASRAYRGDHGVTRLSAGMSTTPGTD